VAILLGKQISASIGGVSTGVRSATISAIQETFTFQVAGGREIYAAPKGYTYEAELEIIDSGASGLVASLTSGASVAVSVSGFGGFSGVLTQVQQTSEIDGVATYVASAKLSVA